MNKIAIGMLALTILGIITSLAPDMSAQISGRSPTCGYVNGKTQKDLDNVQKFCNGAIPKNSGVVSVMAMDSLLWVDVTRQVAEQMRADRLTTEQIVKNWMKVWKKLSGSQAVTVYVQWQDVDIATGETTFFSGDKVTIR